MSSNGGTVCLTFDFDAISLWIARSMTSPGPVSRGEFGAYAIPRILRLLSRHHITSTFFIPGHTLESYPQEVQRIADCDHEIALHGYAHENVSLLTENEERQINERSIGLITELTGSAPKGHRTPSFDFTNHTVQILEELGIEYDSSLMGQDYQPYFARSGDKCPPDAPFEFGKVSSVLEMPVSWTLDDYPHLEFVRTKDFVMPGLADPEVMFRSFASDVEFMMREEPGGVCVVTLHPQAIGRGGRLLALEQFIERCLELGATFDTCLNVSRAKREELLTK
jgi:peptidoglycan/xylan/chitin deacetylase (PgdA/CDA1 family)